MKISTKQAQRIQELAGTMSTRDIGKKLGLHHGTVARYIRKQRGQPARPTDPDSEITSLRPKTEAEMMAVFGMDPKRWVPTQFSAAIRETARKGEVVPLYAGRIACKRVVEAAVEDAVLAFMKEHVKPLARPSQRAKKRAGEPQLLNLGLCDLHLGLYSWASETGKDYDVEIGVNRAFNAIDDLIAEVQGYNIGQVVIPIGNDVLHLDSIRTKTPENNNELDVDTRFARVYLAGLKVLVYLLEQALTLSNKVQVLFVPGNHSPSAAFGLVAALAQRYFNDKRLSFDMRACMRKAIRYGGTFLGFEHGAFASHDRLALAVMTENADLAATATYRELCVGHKHQSKETVYHSLRSTTGFVVRMLGSLCEPDAWTYRQAFTSSIKVAEALRYDGRGFRGSHVATASDEPNLNLEKALVVPGGAGWKERIAL